jgi:hypothetical protein
MLQREKIKRQRLEQIASKPTSSAEAEYFSQFHFPDFSRQGSPQDEAAEREERRQSVERVSYMVDHPLAGVAYGLASLTKASPAARDQALIAGGAVDTVMLGAAPRGASVLGRPTPVRRPPEVPNLRDPIRSRAPNGQGQARGTAGSLTEALLGTGKRANWRRTPPGWQGDGRKFNEARGHLLARLLGGSGDEPNIVTLTHRGANTPQMQSFERGIAGRVRSGEVVEYSAMPLYNPGVLPPSSILLTALGSRGAPTARLINNPAGRRK